MEGKNEEHRNSCKHTKSCTCALTYYIYASIYMYICVEMCNGKKCASMLLKIIKNNA